jgi:hypothetical protein
MTTFIAIYRGTSVNQAKLIAVSVDPALIADVSARLLQERDGTGQDPVVEELEHGRQEALRLIRQEASNECRG